MGESGFEGLGIIKEVRVLFFKELNAVGEGQGDDDDAGLREFFPEGGRALNGTDAVGFGLGEERFLGVEVAEGFPEAGFEELLAGLGRLGRVAEDGAAMFGQFFEVENLRALFFEVVKEDGFTTAGGAGEGDEGVVLDGDEAGEVFDEEASPSFVSTLENAGAPTDGAEDDGHGL